MLAGHDGRRRIVTAADLRAQRLGVKVGMPATKAQVLVPGLAIMEADAKEDAEAFERLALWALRYTPIVSPDAPDGLVIDSSGADHLMGGEEALLKDLISRVEGFGFRVRAAIADTWVVAHALARYSRDKIVIASPGHGLSLIHQLPVSALRVASDTARELAVLGFERIGDVAKQPRAPLALRFGHELGRRLDQAAGVAGEPIVSVRSEELIEVKRSFVEPIAAPETIARYIGKLVVQLCARLESSGLGARRLDLICQRVDNQAQAVRVGMARPVRDVDRLTRLLCDRIETIEPGFGIEQLSLAATAVDPIDARMTTGSLTEEAEPNVDDLIDTLANRIGEKRIYRVAPVPSDVPERSVRRVPAMAAPFDATWPSDWPRPSRLIMPPESIETVALLPDHPPVAFTWRGVRRRVRRADGPERVFGEWWKADAELEAVRDYFRVEDDTGERYWIFRAGDGEDPATGSHRWFVHGVFG